MIKIITSVCSSDRPICRHFLEGGCTYGDSCRFSHEDVANSSPMPLTPPAVPVSQGQGVEGEFFVESLQSFVRTKLIDKLDVPSSCWLPSFVCNVLSNLEIGMNLSNTVCMFTNQGQSLRYFFPPALSVFFSVHGRHVDEWRWQACKETAWWMSVLFWLLEKASWEERQIQGQLHFSTVVVRPSMTIGAITTYILRAFIVIVCRYTSLLVGTFSSRWHEIRILFE